MPADSSNSKPKEALEKIRSNLAMPDKPRPVSLDSELGAIETFSFHVSAAEAASLKEQTKAEQPNELTNRKLPLPRQRQDIPHEEESTHIFVDRRAPLASSRAFELKIKATEPLATKKSKNGAPSWLTSFTVHAVVLLLLSLLTLVTVREPDELALIVSTTASEEVDAIQEIQEIEIDLSEDLDPLDSQLANELTELETSTLGDLAAESELADISSESTTNPTSLGDLGTLFGGSGTGLVEPGDNPGVAAEAIFFGTKVEGNRIVYVVDNSGGMQDGELETLIAELLKSVESLTPKQHFYVIFYSDALYPLFFPQAPQNFVRANEKAKSALRFWLDSVEFCLGNVVDEAIQAALSIRPDVIYLLTDGNLDSTRDQRRMKYLLEGTGGVVPIHTFGMGTGESGVAARKLRQVAEANRGTFRAIPVLPEAEELAKENSRPYRNRKDGPGTVWGTSFNK